MSGCETDLRELRGRDGLLDEFYLAMTEMTVALRGRLELRLVPRGDQRAVRRAEHARPQTVALDKRSEETSVDDIEGAVECHLETGDALLFVDAIAHGSARRTNPGNRRIAVYRYGPSWGHFRLPYRPSPELLNRLTPRRRSLVYPHGDPVYPPGRSA